MNSVSTPYYTVPPVTRHLNRIKMASSGKYTPPHLRGQATQPVVETSPVPPAEDASMAEWLRQARKGYVPKTPEQIREECLQMNFEQLRSRAGPPPTICGDDYGGFFVEAETGDNGGIFNTSMWLFKQGKGAPPAPMQGPERDDGSALDAEMAALGDSKSQDTKSITKMRRDRYSQWYRQWGERLTYLWNKEHPTAPLQQKKTTLRREEEEKPKGPSRYLLTEPCEKSGW